MGNLSLSSLVGQCVTILGSRTNLSLAEPASLLGLRGLRGRWFRLAEVIKHEGVLFYELRALLAETFDEDFSVFKVACVRQHRREAGPRLQLVNKNGRALVVLSFDMGLRVLRLNRQSGRSGSLLRSRLTS